MHIWQRVGFLGLMGRESQQYCSELVLLESEDERLVTRRFGTDSDILPR